MNEDYFNPENQMNRPRDLKSEGLALASLILGLLGAIGLVFVIPPFVFGATAIVLGLLSRTGAGISLKAKIGMFMGGLSMVLLVVILISGIHLLMTNPGLKEDFDRDFNRIYEELENGNFPDNSFT